MKKIALAFLCFLATDSMAQVSQDSTISAKEEIEIIEKDTLFIDMAKYKLTIPNNWKIKAGCTEEQCTANSPQDTLGGFDTYIESINITVNKLSSSSYTAEKYANFSIGYLPKVVKGFKVLEKKRLNSYSYRVTYTGSKNNIEQTWRQYYHVRSSKVYIITFSAQARKYDHYQPIMEPYLASFKFK
ncbi:hypothetical protein SAMN06298216_0393 [Spirosomataceae bacterium TFI 002]|nr:hypothetical protein SAMN06298216_0393 [Spirosomataceae bacterium TFI 002]